MKSIPSARLGLLVAAGVAGAIALTSTTAYAADTSSEKCYGVAKAGKNDYKTDAHSCAGQSKIDKDPASFIELPAGTCEKLNGGSKTPKN